ncbi:MAG: hypothetical protein U0790_14360 [Isosphaeraceae bacterium]
MRTPRTPDATTGGPAGGVAQGVRDAGAVFRILVPGWTQLHWGQRERGLVFAGSWLSASATALVCWGSGFGWLFVGFSILWQVVATLDVLRQTAFPAFPRRIALAAVLVAAGILIDLPVGSVLWTYAWPTEADRMNGAAYLVNRRAYLDGSPLQGHWIWLRGAPSLTPRSGLVLAVADQEVECVGRRWRVDGRDVELPFPGPETDFPGSWRFRVPKDHVLVGPDGRAAKARMPSPLIIVARDQIVGRAWARVYPLWDRSLL